MLMAAEIFREQKEGAFGFMKELFKQIRLAVYLSAVLTIIFGVVLIARPLEVQGLICRVLGILLAVMGMVNVFGYFVDGKGMLSAAGGLLFTLLGIWIFLRPDSVMQLVPIVIGVVLFVHSLRDFQMAIETKRCGGRWGLMFWLALFNCVFGAICIGDSFGIVKAAVRLLGIALVYDGISDIVIVHQTIQAVKADSRRAETENQHSP